MDYHARKPSFVHKLSMIVAAARHSLTINKVDAEKALAYIEAIELKMLDAYGEKDITGDRDFSQILKGFIDYRGTTQGDLHALCQKNGMSFTHDWRWNSFCTTMEAHPMFDAKKSDSGIWTFTRLK